MAWVEQALDPALARSVAAHVNACPSCSALAGDLRAVHARLSAWQVEVVPPDVAAGVRAAVAARRTGLGVRHSARRPSGWRRYRWAAAAAAVVVLGLVGAQVSLCGSVVCYAREAAPQAANVRRALAGVPAGVGADFDAWWRSQPRVDLGVPADRAKVVVVWFVDYECPGCAVSYPVYSRLFAEQIAAGLGAVKLVVRDWPWDSTCNPNVKQTIRGHEASCAAAVAMHLAGGQGTADAMRAWLFSHQGGTSIDDVRTAAREVAGVTDFDARDATENQALQRQLATLAQAGIVSTPSCYINGVRASDARGALLPPAQMAHAIALELASSRTPR
jgi:protein-disulfide isomerase